MEKTNFEKENDKNDIALFRFAIIAPLINNSCEYKSKEEKYPYITGKAIYNKLIEDGDILAKNVSLASLYRFLNSHNFHTHNVTERKAFEMELRLMAFQKEFL